MGERLLRKVVYLPRQMIANIRLISETDGRDENELVRVALGEFIMGKMAQATAIKSFQVKPPIK